VHTEITVKEAGFLKQKILIGMTVGQTVFSRLIKMLFPYLDMIFNAQ
jgi:hypothetical protein